MAEGERCGTITLMDGTLTLFAPAALDVESGASLSAVIDQAVNADVARIVIDLGRTEFLDSTGVGLIVRLYRGTQGLARTLSIRGARGQPLSLLNSLEIPRVIPLD